MIFDDLNVEIEKKMFTKALPSSKSADKTNSLSKMDEQHTCYGNPAFEEKKNLKTVKTGLDFVCLPQIANERDNAYGNNPS